MLRIFAGFGCALSLGAVLGLIMGQSKFLEGFLRIPASMFETIPAMCWALLGILWFGVSGLAPIFVIFSVGFPIVLVNVWKASRSVDRNLIEMAEGFGYNRVQILQKIALPSTIPSFLAAARLSFGFSWRISILAEAIGGSGGVGYEIMRAADRAQTAGVMAWTLIIVLIFLLFERLVFEPIEHRLCRWQR